MNEVIKKYFVPGFLVVVLCLLAIALVYLVKVIQEKENLENQVKSQQKQNQQNQSPPEAPVTTSSEQLKPGEVGEIMIKDENTQQTKPVIDALNPSVITSTYAKILEVREASLLVEGMGSNFVDRQSRTLTGFFTEQTIVFAKNQQQYRGKAGLAVLKPGMTILLEGEGNIRGKTEFDLRTINIVE